jgi:predicted site-specific integrase-resolvase
MERVEPEGGRYYSAQQAIDRLGLSRTGFYQWVRQGRITRVPRRGRTLGMYDRQQIDALAEQLERDEKEQLARTKEELQRFIADHYQTRRSRARTQRDATHAPSRQPICA